VGEDPHGRARETVPDLEESGLDPIIEGQGGQRPAGVGLPHGGPEDEEAEERVRR
jgi:hypothetical protein